MNVTEISESILKKLPGNLDPIVIKHLWDNKPLMKLIMTEKISRNENGKCYGYFYTLLHAVARFGKDELMKNFLATESMVDYRDDCKRTPLWYAAAYNKLKTMDILLKHGARVRLKDDKGWTALHVASINGHYDVCEMLLRCGANPSEPDNCGFYPLHKAIWSSNTKLTQLFIRFSPESINSSSFNNGIYPLHLATLKNLPRMIELLLVKGADVNCQTVDGITPVILSSQLGHGDLCQLFVNNMADVDMTTSSGWTALHMASFYGCVTCVEYLLQWHRKEVINTNNGWTALHVASCQGQFEVVDMLLESKFVNFLSQSACGLTAIDLAAQNGHSQILQRLLEQCHHKYTGPALHLASISGQKTCVSVLIKEAKVNVNEPWSLDERDKYSPVQYAVFAGQREVVCLLLIHGAKFNDVIKAFIRVAVNRTRCHWIRSFLEMFHLFAFY